MTFTASIAGRTSVRAWHPAWEETLWSRSSTFFHVNEIFCNAANGIDVYHGLLGVPQHAEARTLRSGPLYDTAAGSLIFFSLSICWRTPLIAACKSTADKRYPTHFHDITWFCCAVHNPLSNSGSGCDKEF